MTSQPGDHLHPVVEFAQRLGERLGSLSRVPLMSMSAAEKRDALRTLARGEAQLQALRLRVLAEAEQSLSTAGSGAATAADWLAVETREVRRDARSALRLAERLERHALLSEAMGDGRVNIPQARAIVAALERLPRSGRFAVTSQQRTAAEAHLVGLARQYDATALGRLGRRVFEVIAPDLAEEVEGRALQQEEALALRRTTLTMWEDDEGTCSGRFRIPALQGQMLSTMILAIASPARSGGPAASGGIDPDLPTPVRHGIALTQLIEAVPASVLPRTGGCSATVVVTMTLEQLTDRLEAAGVCALDTGGRISAAEARRLACSAGVVPVVLGGKSQVLDVGRRRRLHTESMRLAMAVRDRGCTAEGCETPPGRCHAHHDHPWSAGGSTDVATGRLLCPHHHRRVHDPCYQVSRLPGGRLRFHRRE